MDFTNLSAFTTPDLNANPSPPSFHDPIFTHTHSHNSQTPQHSQTSQPSTSTTSPSTSTSATPPSAPAPKSDAGSRKRPREDEDSDAAIKRQRNTLAARKYRQKRLDRIKELEDALEDMTRDRDDLRIKLARQEAETDALKSMMKMRVEK